MLKQCDRRLPDKKSTIAIILTEIYNNKKKLPYSGFEPRQTCKTSRGSILDPSHACECSVRQYSMKSSKSGIATPLSHFTPIQNHGVVLLPVRGVEAAGIKKAEKLFPPESEVDGYRHLKMKFFNVFFIVIFALVALQQTAYACIADRNGCQPDGRQGNCCSGYCHKQPGWVAGCSNWNGLSSKTQYSRHRKIKLIFAIQKLNGNFGVRIFLPQLKLNDVESLAVENSFL
ncbi:hypothetical protein NQ315_002970 [Exocentrus adspersus]|uniref:Uncharacterized protein n=1 Tax=Exocentrus adspersus TaxID=1586481 RepID=A0AAV8W469_9CUCU|nr:hypothetical protein NQ315_002970 [Exocentrus adspersus]